MYKAQVITLFKSQYGALEIKLTPPNNGFGGEEGPTPTNTTTGEISDFDS